MIYVKTCRARCLCLLSPTARYLLQEMYSVFFIIIPERNVVQFSDVSGPTGQKAMWAKDCDFAWMSSRWQPNSIEFCWCVCLRQRLLKGSLLCSAQKVGSRGLRAPSPARYFLPIAIDAKLGISISKTNRPWSSVLPPLVHLESSNGPLPRTSPLLMLIVISRYHVDF